MEPAGTPGRLGRYLGMTQDYEARSPRILTPEERKARDQTRRADAEQAMREHEASQKQLYSNMERLRAERLAREASAKSQ